MNWVASAFFYLLFTMTCVILIFTSSADLTFKFMFVGFGLGNLFLGLVLKGFLQLQISKKLRNSHFFNSEPMILGGLLNDPLSLATKNRPTSLGFGIVKTAKRIQKQLHGAKVRLHMRETKENIWSNLVFAVLLVNEYVKGGKKFRLEIAIEHAGEFSPKLLKLITDLKLENHLQPSFVSNVQRTIRLVEVASTSNDDFLALRFLSEDEFLRSPTGLQEFVVIHTIVNLADFVAIEAVADKLAEQQLDIDLEQAKNRRISA